MNFLKSKFQIPMVTAWLFSWQQFVSVCLILTCLFLLTVPSAIAGINDDNFEGNVFVLYGGNGSLVPSKVTLTESLKRDRPTFVVYYVDDSRDCKQYATVVSRIQAFYGRAADLIPVNVDAIPLKKTYAPTEPGYYYEGLVPQILIFNQAGEVVLNKKGQVPYEQIDDTFREVFNLVPRSESTELKRRSVNEFSSELTR